MIERKFLSYFQNIVGAEHIITEEPVIHLAETTNYRTDEHIIAIVAPADTKELSRCVIEAGKHRLNIHPFSRGKNWGYGSKVPVADNTVLIDLGRLNKISDYSEKMAYVTIEPGVTFSDLYNYLRENNSELIISTTGGGGDSSVMANALERGIGTGLYAERFANVCGMEVVLPDGSIIATGMGRFGDIPSSKLYKWGMGPSLDGLFSQSNFGIVTKITVWLMSCPEYFRLLFYKINDEEKLPAAIDTLQELAMSGVVRPAITMYNDFRTISTMVQYPWAQCTPGVSSPHDVIKAIQTAIPPTRIVSKWNGEISIRAVNKEHADIQTKIVADAIKNKVDELVVVEIAKEEILHMLKLHHETKNIPHDADIIKSFLARKYIGIPDGTALKQTYWRKKTPLPADMDPDRDQCGLIWICPVVPFAGDDISKAVNIINTVIEKYNLEPAISLQCLSERAVNVIVSIVWDREVPGEDENAEACYAELNQKLKYEGYYPYRDTTKGMEMKAGDEKHDAYLAFLGKIKGLLDPQNILSSGRYNIKG